MAVCGRPDDIASFGHGLIPPARTLVGIARFTFHSGIEEYVDAPALMEHLAHIGEELSNGILAPAPAGRSRTTVCALSLEGLAGISL